MASKLRQRTRRKRRGGSGGSRRGGKASAKRQASARRARIRAENRRSEANIDRARSGGNRRTADVRTDGESTGRERGIAAANTYNRDKKERSLEQSVGSLDRRVEKAIAKGDTDLAKDLRSRQKNFVKKLALERVRKTPGGTIQGNIRMSDGTRPMTTAGFDVFQETMDQDFIDPTRKLQNINPDAYSDMYPISAAMQGGLPTVRLIKKAFGADDKQIPYNLEDMPGVRYPLQRTPVTTRSDRQDPLDERPFTISDRQPGLDPKPVPLPLIDIEFGERPLPDQFPAIDPEKRSEVMEEGYGDILDDVQNFQELDEAFQEDQKRIDAENALQQSLRDEMQMQKTAGILEGSGYNLDQNVINDLFSQGLLEEGTNYFPNPRIGTNPLIDEALQSYYQSLQQ